METVIFRGRAKSNAETNAVNRVEDRETRDGVAALTAGNHFPRETIMIVIYMWRPVLRWYDIIWTS